MVPQGGAKGAAFITIIMELGLFEHQGVPPNFEIAQ